MCNLLVLNIVWLILKGKFLIKNMTTTIHWIIFVVVWIPIIIIIAIFFVDDPFLVELAAMLYYVARAFGMLVNVIFYGISSYWVRLILLM